MRRFLLIPLTVAALSLPAAPHANPAPSASQPAPAPSASPGPTPEDQRAALNREQARKAQQQVDENVARELNNQESAKNAATRRREYEEAMSRYEADKARHDAQVAAYYADYAKWTADVAACRAGDRSRCAKQ